MFESFRSQKAEKDGRRRTCAAHINALFDKLAWGDRAGVWPITTLVLCGVLLIAGVAAGTTFLSSQFRDHALANSERELRNVALVLAEQSDRTLQAIALVENGLFDHERADTIRSPADFDRLMSGRERQIMLKDKINGLPYVRGIFLFDSRGQLLNSSQSWPIPDVNVAKRPFFMALKAQPHAEPMISRPWLEGNPGSWSIYFGRKVIGPDGKFVGAVLATIDLSYFEKLFGSLALGAHSSIAMLGTNGVLLVRHPSLNKMTGQHFSGVVDALRSGGASGTIRLVGRMDQKDRLLAVRRLAHYPLVVSVGLDITDVFADWAREARILITVGILAALAIAALIALVIRQLIRAHGHAQRKLVDQKLQLDTALNNMSHGLCMFDADARLVVCNERYLHMYGLSGQNAKPGCTVATLLEQRKKVGSFSGDPKRYCSELLAAIARGKPYSLLIETADGTTIQIVNQPMADGGWVATHEDISERRRSERQIAYMARHDALTGLANRVLFLEKVEDALAQLRRDGRGFTIFVLDLDEFKTVNDSLGHPIGDELLETVGDRLLAATREIDTVARLGGDEFAILQTAAAADQREAAITLASRLLEAIGAPFDIGGHQVNVGTSIGIALAPYDGSAADQLLKNADLALYRVKGEGRNGFRLFESEMESEAMLRHALGTDLRNAITHGDFELHYQAVFDVATRQPCGAEALIRWRHPQRGMIPPDSFIPLAESAGLIVPLGEWVLRRACEDASDWPLPVKIAVNLSPVQFQRGNLVETVTQALVDSALCPERLELEVTESVLLQNNADNLATLHELKSLGVSIVLDDFGTGYSSLS